MSLDLLNQLEAKVTTTISALDQLRQEVDRLQEENATLREEKQAWEEKLSGLLSKFSELEAAAQQTSSLDETPSLEDREEQQASTWS